MNTSSIKQIVSIVLTSVLLSSCQLGRFVFYNFADINDHKKFQSRALYASEDAFHFHEKEPAPPITIKGENIDNYLEKNETLAFLIIHNDTILYEKYFDAYGEENIIPSFSMAKSVTSILIGCAIDDGLIESVDEPITNYIPELKKNGFEEVSIKHLLQMTSGIDYNESYVNPFGDAASFYYGLNLRKLIEKMELETTPGTRFQYASGNTQLLGLVIERSLNGKNVTQYLQEKLWTPLQMEYDASWSIDRKKEGLEKTYCCLNARARDFAKIGRLYQHKGQWNGVQIVSEDWVASSTMLDTSFGSVDYYQYQWWLPNAGEDFMARGILGQYIYVHPEKDLVMVRLGRKIGHVDWQSLFTSLSNNF